MFKSILQKMNVEQNNQTDSSPAGPGAGDSTAQPASAPSGDGNAAIDPERVREEVIEVLKTVYDPEIPVNIYELGLIYEVRVETNGFTHVRMTLTSPSCPVAGSLPGEVEQKVKTVAGVSDAKIELVWEPQWTMAMMSDAARLQLNMF